LDRPENSYKDWSGDEDRRLRLLWPGTLTREIAKILQRGPSAISGRARVLDLPKKLHRGRRKYTWTLEQDRLLHQRYNSQPGCIDELEKLLPFPRWQIRRRAAALGLVRTKESNWTKRDVKLLKEWLPHRSLNWIAKQLDRTVTGVVLKAKRLGITKSGAGYTVRGLAIGLGVDDHKVVRWIEGGLLKASRRETRRHGGQNGDYWYIAPSAAREFIVSHPDEISVRSVDKRFFIRLLAAGHGQCERCGKKV
jgi:hypothetical protein